MEGTIKFNGKETNVKIRIEDNEVILTFPTDTDTSNWYHAITIKRED